MILRVKLPFSKGKSLMAEAYYLSISSFDIYSYISLRYDCIEKNITSVLLDLEFLIIASNCYEIVSS